MKKCTVMTDLCKSSTRTDYRRINMKWNTELPKEEGYYICTVEVYGNIKVRPVVWKKDTMYGYLKPEGYDVCYAWMPFPKWDDEWNEIPHYTDNTKWRDYCPKEDGEYIVKSISGWKPYETRAICTQRYSKGHWRIYPNEPLNPKYDFVYGWLPLPKPFDCMYQLPIYHYQRAIGLNDKAKQGLKEFYNNSNIYVTVGDKTYRETFDENEGFIRTLANESTL